MLRLGIPGIHIVDFPSSSPGAAASPASPNDWCGVRSGRGSHCVNQAGPIAAVFTAAVLGGAGVGSSFLGAEFREPVGGTPSNTFSEDVPDGASSSGAYTMGGLEQLASAAAEMPRCTFPEG